ncbi:MAG TPA: ATP-binding protein [Terriglobales bacterium]|nr:ATP-binding protein [Terriglobales bacterium]
MPQEINNSGVPAQLHSARRTESGARRTLGGRLTRSISTKLIALLLGTMLVTFGLLGYLNIRLHRKHFEANTLSSAERISDTIKRSTSYHMLRNDRESIYNIISTIGAEPGIVRVRILDKEGRINYSSDPAEINKFVDQSAEACYGCHAHSQPLTRLNRPDRFRIYKPNGERVLGVINPIENQPSCSNAACHYHPASQQILGVLDTNLSLAKADASVAESTWRMLLYTFISMVGISILTWLFVWKVVHDPIRALKSGTEQLTKGDLGYQIEYESDDEAGELAESFNHMSLQLRAANEEITAWARTLEQRVEQKSAELKRAHDKMLQVEKMASIGKLAAVVAHEVNNPLSGILTYSKLMRKWMDKRDFSDNRLKEFGECLDLISSESRRCGELVKNLLTFSRTGPINLTWANLNQTAERCVRLTQHKLEMASIQLNLDLDASLPLVHCDPAQIEQVLLALVMNAIDAMPRGGNLWLRTRSLPASKQVELQVRDDGSGIPDEVLSKLFEPFTTTKEIGKGVGLGLAISKSIVDRHGGQIVVDSEVGRGTNFYIFLPLDANTASGAAAANGASTRGAAAK